MTTESEARSISIEAIAKGWLKFTPKSAQRVKPTSKPRPAKLTTEERKARHHDRVRKVRAIRKAAGLNVSTGKPLLNRKHPELHNRGVSNYDALFSRKWRQERKGLTIQASPSLPS